MDFSTIVILLLLAFFLYRRFSYLTNKQIKNVSAEKAHELIKGNKNIIVLDVRTKGEYKSGHIPGAKSIPVAELSSRIKELEQHRDTPILVHCASGGRSPAALKVLLKNGFKTIYHMNRGLIGWNYGLK